MFNKSIVSRIRNPQYLYHINRAMRPTASQEDIRLGKYFYGLAENWFRNNGRFFKNTVQ